MGGGGEASQNLFLREFYKKLSFIVIIWRQQKKNIDKLYLKILSPFVPHIL